MTIAIANTEVTNTFDYWRQRTNELAAAMSIKAVTVNSNAAIGNASVTGSLYANVLFTPILTGGAIGATANITISTNATFSSNAAFQDRITVNNLITGSSANLTANLTVAGTLTIGATVANSTTVTSTHLGTWNGNTIAPNKGGTGYATAPAPGQILIGTNANNYVANQLTAGAGIGISSGSGNIIINSLIAGVTANTGIAVSADPTTNIYSVTNIGVLGLRANSSNAYRTGNVTITTQDIVDALTFFPSAANAAIFLPAQTDTYFPGNSAIGFVVANTGVPSTTASSNATLDVRSIRNTGTLPVIRVDNANAASAAFSAMIDINVANTSAKSAIRFGKGAVPGGAAPTVMGGIEYRHVSDNIGITIGGTEKITIDSAGSFGIGTAPSPNEGGQGIHVAGTVPGYTLSYTGAGGFNWHMGINPAFNVLSGGARLFDAFGVYSDESSSGLVFAGKTAATATASIWSGGFNRLTINTSGQVGIGNTSPTTGAMLHVQGDVFSTGYQTLSDYRNKENVVPVEDAVNRVKLLNPVQFDYITGYKNQEGFIAHELQRVVPCAVTGVKDGFVPQTIDKTNVIALLTKALQDVINRVEALEGPQ